MKDIAQFFIIVVFSLSIFSCNQYNTSLEIKDNDLDRSYPSKDSDLDFESNVENNLDKSYPLKTDNEVQEKFNLVIPTANNTSGIIYGRILSTKNEEPIAYSKLYLASKIRSDDDNKNYIFTYQVNSSPNTITTQNGEFLFPKIPPGNYIILLVTPINTYPLLNSNLEETEFSIEGGEIFDLGILYTTWLDFD